MSKFVLGPLQTKWIEFLEQNPDKQGRNFLGIIENGKEKMCCLGAGGLILGTCEWLDNNLIDTSTDIHDCHYLRSYEKLGLRDSRGCPSHSDLFKSLTTLNDHTKTWTEIAKLLREKPEIYFTHSV